MNAKDIQEQLSSLPLGGIRFFNSIGSTNEEALAWARDDAQDLSLVAAEEQTAGRGRSSRKWFTPSGSALAFSLILRPVDAERTYPSRVTGLVALALTDVIQGLSCEAQIKWPNDVLLRGRKVAGILVESVWTGSKLDAVVLGVGVNVGAASVPLASQLLFPATCVEAEVGHLVHRPQLLKAVLLAIMGWRTKLVEDEFIRAWESHLAFRGQQVQISRDGVVPLTGMLSGLESDGSLRLMVDSNPVTVKFGEIHLRPAL